MDELRSTMDAQVDAMVATLQMALAPRYGNCVFSGDFPMSILEELYIILLKNEELLPETMKLFGYKRRLSKYFHGRDKDRYPTVDIRDWRGPSDLRLPTPVMAVLLYNGLFRTRAVAQAKAAVTNAAKRSRVGDVKGQEAKLRAVKRQREALQAAPRPVPTLEEPVADAFEAGGF